MADLRNNQIPTFLNAELPDAEPLTDEEQYQQKRERQRQRFYKTLDWLCIVAAGDDEPKDALFETAKWLKKKDKPGSPGALMQLLVRYALLVEEFGDDKDRVLNSLIEWNARSFGGAIVSQETMDNRVSDAIRKIDPANLPPWTQEIIKRRQERNRHIRK